MSTTLPSAQWSPHACQEAALSLLLELHKEELCLQVSSMPSVHSSPHDAARAAVGLVQEMEARVTRLRQTQTNRERDRQEMEMLGTALFHSKL